MTTTMRGWLAAVVVASGGFAQVAWGSPSTLHIGSGYGTACETGGCPIYNGEINNVGTPVPGQAYTGGMDIFQNQGGAKAVDDPLLLIFAVANGSSGTRLSQNSLAGASLIDATGSRTAIDFTFAGYQGAMTAGDVYGFLANTAFGKGYAGLSGMNNSNSFTNWSAADLAVDNIAASDFGIYVFALDPAAAGVSFAGKDFIDIALNSIPEGTFAVAYGQSTATNNKVTAYGAPFTEAGLVDQPPGTPVPEPGSLAVFTFGLALLSLIGRSLSFGRRRSR